MGWVTAPRQRVGVYMGMVTHEAVTYTYSRPGEILLYSLGRDTWAKNEDRDSGVNGQRH